ncbi:ABC transporter substrate-binding protein [Micromonosporaceae bacterium DT194]|uniref:ABC transporter substrate-binding protein n=1 Tax=Melissospora conviva TaxID=3388432 RepID=UPI003C24F511
MTVSARRTGPALVAGLAVLGLLAAGCTDPRDSASDPGSIVLADAYEPETLNPIAGYSETGESKIHDGLFRIASAGADGRPRIEPALAAAPAEISADAREWTITLRDGVRFHDGSAFDADDVVATYRAILDPAVSSPLVSSYEMIDSVEKADGNAVRFRLKYSYAPFDRKLLLGIVPSEALATPAPVTESAMNNAPVGTGPYKLESWRKGSQLVLVANDAYWDGVPQVKKLTYVIAADDNTRAQRTTSGEFDGAWLPPKLAGTFADTDGYTVVAHPSADWRSVSLPAGDPVAGDPAIRLALNHAVDRQAMVDSILAGYGAPAYTPVSDAFGDYHDAAVTFAHDPAKAEQLLDAAGWQTGADGIRVRDGKRAAFTLMYFPTDILRRDLSLAFASDAKKIGIEVSLDAVDRPQFRPRIPADASLVGGGDNPYDPDTQLYPTLHSRYADHDAANPFRNPSGHRDAEVDAALDAGRRTTDEAARQEAYRTVQAEYAADPSHVMLVFLHHTYVMKDGGWTGTTPVLEPHAHGVTWGPWWNIEDWTRQ